MSGIPWEKWNRGFLYDGKEGQMLEIIPNMPENVLAVNAKGKVTGEDYDRVLIPAVEDKLKGHKKVRVLYQLGPDFSGFTAEAMWDDAKVGIRHITVFEKIAVVSDVDWIAAAVKIFAFVIPCPVKVFNNEELPKAKAWVIK
jgi:SpoIIAA-like